MQLTTRSTRLLAFLLLAVACSWGMASTGFGQKPALQSQQIQTHQIIISDFMYHPDVVTVHIGDTVEWKNADIVPHTVTASDRSFNSGSIKPGASWKFVAKKAGTFPYVCSPHPNMHGKLIVQ